MLHDQTIIDLVRTALMVTLKVSGPILAAGVVIGLIISILQSVTSIQDQTLTFVPKIVVMVLVAAILLGWIVERMVAYAQDLFLLST
jgi:flagellar biosynthetic protein FliQ